MRVRRAGAGADDRLAHPLRPAARRRSAPTCSPTTSTSAPSCGGCASDDPTRGIGDAAARPAQPRRASGTSGSREGCFLAGVDPWRPLRRACRTRRRSRSSAGRRGRSMRGSPPSAAAGCAAASAHGLRARRACPAGAAATRIRARGQGDDNRTTYWCPRVPGVIRVGHKGADHVAPGNTIESFEAALEHGVDMIEFDVLRTRDGRLVLAHDYEDADSRECLDARGGPRPLRRRGLRGRGARRGPEAARLRARGGRRAGRARADGALARVDAVPREPRPSGRARAPGCGAAGRCRGCGATTRSQLASRRVAYGVARWCAARLPGQAAALMRRRRLRGGHGPLAAGEPAAGDGGARAPAARSTSGPWTTRERIRALEALGVDGVITNDPRLFG